MRTFFLKQIIAACNCTGLFTNLKLIIQFTSILTIYLQSNATHTGDYSVGSDVVAMAYRPLWQGCQTLQQGRQGLSCVHA